MPTGVSFLSEDLLQLLFESVLDRSDPKAYHDQLAALRLVTRSWNTLIENWSKLWTVISINLPLEMTRRQLIRSGNSLPLEIHMTTPVDGLRNTLEVRRWNERTETLAEALRSEAWRISVWRISAISSEFVVAGPTVRALLSHPLPSLTELYFLDPAIDSSHLIDLVLGDTPDSWTKAPLISFFHRLVEGVDQTSPPTIRLIVHDQLVSLCSPHLHLRFENLTVPHLVKWMAESIGGRKISMTMRGKIPIGICLVLRLLISAVTEIVLEGNGWVAIENIFRDLQPYRRPSEEVRVGWVFPELRSIIVRLPTSPDTTSSQIRVEIYRQLLRQLKARSQGRTTGPFRVVPARPVTLRLCGARGGLTTDVLEQLRLYTLDVILD